MNSTIHLARTVRGLVALLAVGLASGCASGQSEAASSGNTPEVLAADPFTSGLGLWRIESQDPTGTVTASDGVLDVVQPSGATLWFKPRLSGDYEIRFSASPIPFTNGVYVDRISDLNVFWNATVPGAANPDPTGKASDGALASYTPLALYYVGFGANNNTTTRLRRYDGTDARPQLAGYAVPGVATAEDTLGPMSATTSLAAQVTTKVRIVSRHATADDPLTLKWFANDALVFSYADPAPYLSGWFALRTTASHLQIRDFAVIRR